MKTGSTAPRSASPATTVPPGPSPFPGPRSEDNTSQNSSPDQLAPEVRYHMIAVAAYLRAEQRALQNGSPEEDWLQAEIEVDEFLAQTQRARSGLEDTPGPSRNQ